MRVTKNGELEALAANGVFRGVGHAWLAALLADVPVRELAAGEVLVAPGAAAEAIYVVVSGAVTERLATPEGAPLRQVAAGECVGEEALTPGGRANAWVVAETPARLLVLPAPRVWELVEGSHAIAINLLDHFALHLRRSNDERARGLVRERAFEQAATIDALTGLYNRRWLDETFDRQLRRCLSAVRPASLLMLDVDEFKAFNDTYGHPAGDAVLQLVAGALRTTLRPTDLVARYGGEEFAALLPDTSIVDACSVAERVRAGVERIPSGQAVGREVPSPTVSIGIAAARPGRPLAELIERADGALRRAKSKGRNCWMVAPNRLAQE